MSESLVISKLVLITVTWIFLCASLGECFMRLNKWWNKRKKLLRIPKALIVKRSKWPT